MRPQLSPRRPKMTILQHSIIYFLLSTLVHYPCSCQASSVTSNKEFYTLPGQRVNTGGTELTRLSEPGLTLIRCAALCKQDCGVFHFSSASTLCVIFAEKLYEVETTQDSDWDIGYRQTATVVNGDWTLVFRLQAATGESAYDAWTDDGRHNDNPVIGKFPFACLRMSEYSSCDRHFRSHILDDWTNINEVYLSVIKNSTEVGYIVYDGAGTDRMTWFDETKILQSSWMPGVKNDADLNPYTDIAGYCKRGMCRRFYVFGTHRGCSKDWFYFVVFDNANDICDRVWNHTVPDEPPSIAYSPSSGRAVFGSDRGALPLGEFADVMAVYVK